MNGWSAGETIKRRRKSLGYTLTEIADAIGVSKAFLSYVESNARTLTEQQARDLSKVLALPVDLLLVGTGRLPRDVEIAISKDRVAVTASVREEAERYAVTYPHTLESTLETLPESNKTVDLSSVPARICVSKGSASYRAHSYHTKVPPEAITPFIEALTEPDDLVLDPFCGSGMTGVAARMTGRECILSDLSPAAVHIARNYSTPCDPKTLASALSAIEEETKATFEWLYRSPDSMDELIEYTTWSDVFECTNCSSPIVVWDVVHSAKGRVNKELACSHCGAHVKKQDLRWIGAKPVQTHVSKAGNHRVYSHPTTEAEEALVAEVEQTPIPYWIPDVPFGPAREMWRASHREMGIDNVNRFFTRRNLHALAALRHAIITSSSGRVREALMFAFTACVNRASKRYQWNAKRPTNVMTGTLYVSSLRYEWNVWSLFKRKFRDALRYFEDMGSAQSPVRVINRTATDLSPLPDNSISMVFMDPPFGANIFYSDSSLLWEAWLGTLTDGAEEIVVNKSRARIGGGKTLADYGSLMGNAFREVSRVVRKSGYAVLAFSNSDDKVWVEIQKSLAAAGLQTSSVHLLSKGQPSIKGVKGVSGKEAVTCLDLLIVLKNTKQPQNLQQIESDTRLRIIDEAIREELAQGDKRTDEIYSRVLQALLSRNVLVENVTMRAVAQRCEELGGHLDSGRWRLADKLFNRPTDVVSLYLSETDLPVGQMSKSPSAPPNLGVVSGGRSSTFYTAHSYHTKVPPESIIPFLEHYTNPGDVVLDPFCGSGMTGVAAALTGRRAILNDLSPAAVHLAWNHTHPCDSRELMEALEEVECKVGTAISDMYRTTDHQGCRATATWVMWSTKHQCPNCESVFRLWDAIDKVEGRMGPYIRCPLCARELTRRQLESTGSEPAWISYRTADGKRGERAAGDEDIALANSFSRNAIPTWYPTEPLGPDREMYIRCALHRKGISNVADFYTSRNLHALSLMWDAINGVVNERARLALAFAFTNTAWHGTRMRRFNARGGQRPLTGTLYIPQLSSEANVLDVFKNKIRQLVRYYDAFNPQTLPVLLNDSATELKQIADGTIDYVFTDPPFGSNLFYADCNLIWESWLGRITDPSKEAVVNRSLRIQNGGKSLDAYGTLMSKSLKEIFRVLKPDGWATVVFHNTDPDVWAAIREAAIYAGFEFEEAASLDRKQKSHKGYKGGAGKENVAHFDVIMNLKKPNSTKRRQAPNTTTRTRNRLEDLLLDIAANNAVVRRGIQGVHAEVMRRQASMNADVFFSYAEVKRAWEKLFTN